jgi:hypothetical protein
MNNLEKQMQRVQIAGELLENASLTKTKKAAKNLGDETLKLLSGVVGEINKLTIEVNKLRAAK